MKYKFIFVTGADDVIVGFNGQNELIYEKDSDVVAYRYAIDYAKLNPGVSWRCYNIDKGEDKARFIGGWVNKADGDAIDDKIEADAIAKGHKVVTK